MLKTGTISLENMDVFKRLPLSFSRGETPRKRNAKKFGVTMDEIQKETSDCGSN